MDQTTTPAKVLKIRISGAAWICTSGSIGGKSGRCQFVIDCKKEAHDDHLVIIGALVDAGWTLDEESQPLYDQMKEMADRRLALAVEPSEVDGDGYIYTFGSAQWAIWHWRAKGCQFQHASDVCTCRYIFFCPKCEAQQTVSGEDMNFAAELAGCCQVCA